MSTTKTSRRRNSASRRRSSGSSASSSRRSSAVSPDTVPDAKKTPEGENPEAPAVPEKPKPAVSLWAHNRLGKMTAPLAWTGVADTAAFCFRCAVHASGFGSDAALAGGGLIVAAAGVRTVWQLRRRRDPGQKAMPPLTAVQKRARKRALTGWIAAAAWAPMMIWGAPLGPGGLVQEAALFGGLAVGAGHMHASRRQEIPWLQRDAIAGPGEDPGPDQEKGPDPREESFRKRFIDGPATGPKTRPLAGARIEDFAEVDGGFSFVVVAGEETNVTIQTVHQQRPMIAAHYDVPLDQVMVDDAPKRSARRSKVTVLTLEDAFAAPRLWDGLSTYDPKTGAVNHGRFGDGTSGRWRFHAPGSGMWGGFVYGAMGTGKSFDLHKLAGEAGIVIQCPGCGAFSEEDGRCDDCSPSRIFLIFMGDPQCRAFGPWEGCADLLFFGEDACVFQQRFLREVMIERDREAGTRTRTDKKGRTRKGAGWFDPTPGVPGILGITDEWTKVVNSANGAEAVEDAEVVNREARKSGLGEIFASQMPDAGQTGGTRALRTLLRDFNTVAHRLDPMGKAMTAVKGNAVDLPDGEDMAGIGYIAGIDNRSAAPFRTDHLPEDAAEGQVDVLDMAEQVADLPVVIDPAVQRVMDRYEIKHRDVITDAWVAALRAREENEGRQQAVAGGQNDTAGPGSPGAPVAGGPVTIGAMRAASQAVAACVDETGAAAMLYDVMERTTLTAGQAERALAALETSGEVTKNGARAWIPGNSSSQKAVSVL